jgi:hypothetical protein
LLFTAFSLNQDYLITDLLPMYTVEKKGFKKLMQELAPHLRIRTRRFFTRKLASRFRRSVDSLKDELGEVKYACTTADMWESRRRGFIASMVTWLRTDLTRKSACLGIRRVTEAHTFDVLAKYMEDMNEEFGITNKTTATITDSGSYIFIIFIGL